MLLRDQCCQHTRALALLAALFHLLPYYTDRYLCAEEEMRESWESLRHNNSVYEYINSEILSKREYIIVRGIIDQVCRLAVSPPGGYWAGRRRVRAAKNDTAVGSWAPERIHFSCSRGRPMLARSARMRHGCVSRSSRCFCTRLFPRYESRREPPRSSGPALRREG